MRGQRIDGFTIAGGMDGSASDDGTEMSGVFQSTGWIADTWVPGVWLATTWAAGVW